MNGYNGWKNPETWTFNLWWQNDQGIYAETLEFAAGVRKVTGESTYALGEQVIDYWQDLLENYAVTFGEPLPPELADFYREVGSWWRVDRVEVGEAVLEALAAENEEV